MLSQGVTFEQVVSRGCGLDVHKETVVATIKGEGILETTRTFQTFTSSLKDLQGWLKSVGVTHVAMESTGIYWKPVYSVLEESFEILLVNARHINEKNIIYPWLLCIGNGLVLKPRRTCCISFNYHNRNHVKYRRYHCKNSGSCG